jgi:hypothetical protein
MPGVAAQRPWESWEAEMRHALTRHLQLASVRDMDWVTAHFGHR